MSVYNRIDAVMIEQIRSDGETQAGIYAGSYRILNAMNMIGYLFAGLLLPMFAKSLSENKRINDLLKRA